MVDILTYADGRPIPRPEPEDYDSSLAYLRAVHAYRDEVARVANSAFDERLRRALRGDDADA